MLSLLNQRPAIFVWLYNCELLQKTSDEAEIDYLKTRLPADSWRPRKNQVVREEDRERGKGNETQVKETERKKHKEEENGK